MRIMADTEKITMDLGRIDVLVEQGLYSNRTDAIRTGIRNLLDRHEAVIQEISVRKTYSMGFLIFSQADPRTMEGRGEEGIHSRHWTP